MKRIAHHGLEMAHEFTPQGFMEMPVLIGVFDNDYIMIEQPSTDGKFHTIGIHIDDIPEFLKTLSATVQMVKDAETH